MGYVVMHDSMITRSGKDVEESVRGEV